MQSCQCLSPLIIPKELNVVMIVCICRIEGNDSSCLQPLVLNDLLYHCLSVVEELSGFFSDCLVVEDLRVGAVRILASDLPALEEGVPVEEVH